MRRLRRLVAVVLIVALMAPQLFAQVVRRPDGFTNQTDNLGLVRAVPIPSIPIEAKSAANTQVTLTLTAVNNQFHYITSIRIMRTCTTAIVGTAALDVTTTNLPNSMRWVVGNACAVGTTNVDVMQAFFSPIKATAANTNTTIVCPAIGTAGICAIAVTYYTGI